MSEAPPTNRLLQLLRQKPEPQDKSSTQYATQSDTQYAQSDTQPVTKSSTPKRPKSSIQYATRNNDSNARDSLSKGQDRVLRYLDQNRDPERPEQTVLIGYDTISTFCFLSRSGSRKVVGELQKKGLITRLDVRRGKTQGSVYTLQSDTPYATKSDTPLDTQSDTPYATKSDTRSSSLDLKKQLQQDLIKLILEKAFADLNPHSISPYLGQFEDLAEVQNFLDMANACIDASQTNGKKQIQNPQGFLFAQLRAGYINPPPGFKSRRVLAQEAMNAQLQAEIDAMRQLQEREAELRFELFKAGLTDDQRETLEAEAASRVKPKAPMSRKLQMEVYREEVLQEWFAEQGRDT